MPIPWPTPERPRETTRLAFDQSTATVHTVISSDDDNSGAPISLIEGSFECADAVTVDLYVGPTIVSTWNLAAAGAFGFSSGARFEGTAGQDVKIKLSAAVRVTGRLSYMNRYRTDPDGNYV